MTTKKVSNVRYFLVASAPFFAALVVGALLASIEMAVLAWYRPEIITNALNHLHPVAPVVLQHCKDCIGICKECLLP